MIIRLHNLIICAIVMVAQICSAQLERLDNFDRLKEENVNEPECMIVVRDRDGLMAVRQASTLFLVHTDTTRTVQSDLILSLALCNCPELPADIISSLLDNGYSVEDLILFGVFPPNSHVQTLLNLGVNPLTLFNYGVPIDSLIGKMYQDGYLFYLDTLNLYRFDGLIAAEMDVGRRGWGCSTADLPNVPNVPNPPNPPMGLGAEIGDGKANTLAIIQDCSALLSAARYCYDYESSDYSDWYLPSALELNLVYKNLADPDGDQQCCFPGDPNNIGGFILDQYWSSTERGSRSAWTTLFTNGSNTTRLKGQQSTRPIREF